MACHWIDLWVRVISIPIAVLSDLSLKQRVRVISPLGVWASIASAVGLGLGGWAAEAAPTFERDIRPILKVACFHCHGEDDERKGGLDVRLVRLMMEGGDSGSAITPGDLESSLLWEQIDSDEMPKGEKKLSSEQKKTIRQWIELGAKTARPEPYNVEDARFTEEELSHWAFQPVEDQPYPHSNSVTLNTPIDGFIAARLAEKGLVFSEPADRATLIRRVSFDLTGLPPSPEEVATFEDDPRPDAYPRLVSRLLASPEFGVRWGRHWLDVAGYSESDGGVDSDPKREYAWRYRDYVIEAFNQNKPVDQFIREQLAGDELIREPLDTYNSRHLEYLTATGFMRMAPDPTQSSNTLSDRNMAAAEAIQVISTTMLGLTVGCAQCHDHKYDPIGIDDYYRFRAVFDPVFPLKNWQQPNARLVDMTTEEVKAEAARIEANAKVIEDDLNRRRRELGSEIQELKLADVPDAVRDATRKAVLTKNKDRTDRQKELLDLYPMVKPVSNIVGLLVEYDGPSYRKFEKEQQKITAVRATKPALRKVMATMERPGVIPTSQIFFRGNPEAAKEEVQPNELMVLTRLGRDVSLPINDGTLPSTGRRLAYAKQLTDGSHPLTARVFVNRLWLHHIGRGLVASPNDFGLSGDRPSHPKLLDWLATDFVKHGWDQKRLHRMILLSRTFQQSSRRTPELDAIDPENILFGRANLRRLQAEEIRDAILSVTDNINHHLGGPSIPVTQNGEGKVVIGVQKIRDGIPVGANEDHPDAYRRSAFIEVQRSLPLNMLSTFDLPAMTPNCDLRRPTTVATQSLWFMNDSLMVGRGADLASHLHRHFETSQERITALFIRLFAKPPSADQERACLEFLEEQKEVRVTEKTGNHDALATLCQTLMASNRFLYID